MFQKSEPCPFRGICKSAVNSDSKGPGLMYPSRENAACSKRNSANFSPSEANAEPLFELIDRRPVSR